MGDNLASIAASAIPSNNDKIRELVAATNLLTHSQTSLHLKTKTQHCISDHETPSMQIRSPPHLVGNSPGWEARSVRLTPHPVVYRERTTATELYKTINL